MTTVLHRAELTRPLVLIALALKTAVHASALSVIPDTARRNVATARQAAQAWKKDAKLIYLSNGTPLTDQGATSCDANKPRTGWMFKFRSAGADQSFVAYLCQGKSETGKLAKATTPSPRLDAVADDFIDTDVVRRTLDQTSREWGLPPPNISLTLRNPESKVWADKQHPKGRTIWEAYLSWNEKVFASVLIDAETGVILKKKAPAASQRK